MADRAAGGRLPVYVINLDRSPERLARFRADNAMPDLDIVRIEAIDGQKLDRAELVSRNVIAEDLVYTNNAVACALSHLAVWRRILAEGRPAVVCEDDAVLRRDFGKVHRQLTSTVEPWDLVYWSAHFGLHMIYEVPGLGDFTSVTDDKHLDSEEKVAAFQASSPPTNLFRAKRVWGTACYTLSPQGAEKLLKLVLPLRNGEVPVVYRTGLWMEPQRYIFPVLGIDGDMGLIHIDKLAARIAVPPLAVPRVTASTIDSGPEVARYQAPYVDSVGKLHIPLPLESTKIRELNDTGLELHALERSDRAIAYFDRALTINPNVAEPHYNRGNALSALGRLDDAVASYDKALAIRPTYASAFNNRGLALAALGLFADAIASYDRVLTIEPDHPRARANRDALLEKTEPLKMER